MCFGTHDFLEIDEEFRLLMPSSTKEEFDQLEKNILADGEIREKVTAWGVLVVDGMTRLRIARKHNLPFHLKHINFNDNEECKQWIRANQLGRRNLTPDQASILRGQIYNSRKAAQGGERDGAGRKTEDSPEKESKAHREPLITTAEQVAKETGVSRETIKRDGKLAASVAALDPKVAQAVVDSEVKGTRAAVAELAKQSPAKQRAAVEKVKSGKAKKLDDVVKPKKNGAVKGWDVKTDAKFASTIGQLARMVDDRKKALGPSPSHQKVLDSLNAALVEYRAWQKAKAVA